MLHRPRKAAFLFLFSILVVTVAINLRQANDAESDVHLAVLKDLSGKLKINEFTFYSHPSTCRGVKQSSHPAIAKDIFADFYQNNNVIHSKPRLLELSDKNYNAVNKEDSQRIYSGKSPVLNGIPKQLINLSRAGINASRTQALVCVESEESGDLVYVEKEGTSWIVKKWSYTW